MDRIYYPNRITRNIRREQTNYYSREKIQLLLYNETELFFFVFNRLWWIFEGVEGRIPNEACVSNPIPRVRVVS